MYIQSQRYCSTLFCKNQLFQQIIVAKILHLLFFMNFLYSILLHLRFNYNCSNKFVFIANFLL